MLRGAHSKCSSGIGLATVQALAAQGLNVVLVAMPDALLTKAHKELQEQYAAQVSGWVGGGGLCLRPSTLCSYTDPVSATCATVWARVYCDCGGHFGYTCRSRKVGGAPRLWLQQQSSQHGCVHSCRGLRAARYVLCGLCRSSAPCP